MKDTSKNIFENSKNFRANQSRSSIVSERDTALSHTSRAALIATALLAAIYITSACSTTDGEKIASAQECLDRTTAANALSCMDKVSGLDSSAANYMRCAAYFVYEGFSDPNNLVSAINALQTSGGSAATNNATVMNVLAFKARGTNLSDSTAQTNNANDAIAAFNYCNKANSKGMVLLATFAQTATIANKLAATAAGCTAGSMANSITCLKTNASATEKQAIGTAIAASYESSCTGGKNTSPAFCSLAQSAVSSGATAEQIANSFLGQL